MSGWRIVLLASAALGMAASMLAFWEYRWGSGVCDFSSLFSCSTVYMLEEARIPVIGVHFSEAAPVYFTVFSALTLAWVHGGYRVARLLLLAVLIGGAAVIPYLVYLEIARAGALCLYCTIMHASILAGLLAVYKEGGLVG